MRYKLTISYDGSSYYGFQKQPNQITVEQMLIEALSKVYKKQVTIIASGRTDKGVHALAQVVHFDADIKIEPGKLLKALNRQLPADIRALNIKEVDDNFHARFDATKKTYEYVLTQDYDLFNRNYETYVPYKIDINKMREVIKLFEGTHDFFGFSTYVKDKPTVKTIFKSDLTIKDGKIILTFTGDNFLRHMIRKMVGTLIEIAQGKKDKEVILKIFESRDTSLCGKIASPNGLYLKEVFYM